MRLVIDESVRGRVLAGVEEDGHELLRIRLILPGLPDDRVLAFAAEQQALLVTGDRDFGELLFRLAHSPVGVLFLRLGALPVELKSERLRAVIRDHGPRLSSAFTVVTPARTRIRDYPSMESP